MYELIYLAALLTSDPLTTAAPPAFWVYALCKRDDNRCLPLLRASYDRVVAAPAASFAPITYCPVEPSPSDAQLKQDFVRVAHHYNELMNLGASIDRIEAAVLQSVMPCEGGRR